MSIEKIVAEEQPALIARPVIDGPPPQRNNPLRMIWRRRNVLAIVTLACVLAAFVKYMVSPRFYRSEAKLFVQVPNRNDNIPPNVRLQTECDFITSSPILAQVAVKKELNGFKTLADTTQRYETLSQNLLAKITEKSELILLSYEGRTPEEAQAILEAIIDTYSKYYRLKREEDVTERKLLKERAEERLAERQKQLDEFRAANPNINFWDGADAELQQRIREITAELETHETDAATLRGLLDKLPSSKPTPTVVKELVREIRALNRSNWQPDGKEVALRAQLETVQKQKFELEQRYGDKHPAVQSANASVDYLEKAILTIESDVLANYFTQIRDSLTAVEKKREGTRKRLDAVTVNRGDFKKKYPDFDRLSRRKREAEEAVEAQSKALEHAQDTILVGVPNVTTFNHPSRPGLASRPSFTLLMFQGLMIGLLLGCGAALLRDVTDQGLRNADEITQTVNAALLGSVPHMAGSTNPLSTGRKVDLEPASSAAESYRTIRTAVFFGTPERESRTILVTSPSAGEGKSTFASNVAIAMAQTGKRVLLIDCDFRRPVQHRVFESRPGVGLTTVLLGKETLDEAIQPTGIPDLFILPAGPIPNNPAEILNSQSFIEVLEELSVRFEHVVIDSPPVLAVADARILAAMCSVTILVIRAGASTRKAAGAARKALDSVGAHILGVVVNDVPSTGEQDHYGDYSSYRNEFATARNGGAPVATDPDPSAGQVPTKIPAKSFLDLRRK